MALVNGVVGSSQRVEPRAQVEQQRRVEAGADLAGEHEVVALEVADEQRAEAHARALRIGESADHQFLRRLALHLEPGLRAAVFVRRVAALGDHAFPSLAARPLPRRVAVQRLYPRDREPKRNRLEQRATLVQAAGDVMFFPLSQSTSNT